ncbi:MAG: 30S ribosomal protein S20 [Proteobacteria bacterium]|nr:30S ribosomal protein S20 [Pseudomonadota bacterium]
MKQKQRNRYVRSTVRTSVKAVRRAIEQGESAQATEGLKTAIRNLDKAVTKGVLKRQTASRTISRLTIAVNRATAAGN